MRGCTSGVGRRVDGLGSGSSQVLFIIFVSVNTYLEEVDSDHSYFGDRVDISVAESSFWADSKA